MKKKKLLKIIDKLSGIYVRSMWGSMENGGFPPKIEDSDLIMFHFCASKTIIKGVVDGNCDCIDLIKCGMRNAIDDLDIPEMIKKGKNDKGY